MTSDECLGTSPPTRARDALASRRGARRQRSARVRDARPEDLDTVVRLHAAAFPGFFLTRLGPRFLKAYYRLVLERGILQVIVQDEQTCGFVAGFLAPAQFYRTMKRDARRFAIPLLIALAARPRLVLHIVRSVLRVSRAKSEAAHDSDEVCELSSLAVHPRWQRQGLGGQLVRAFLSRARNLGAAEVRLTTGACGNDRVRRFYQGLGFRLTRTFLQSSGRRMVEYSARLRDPRDDARPPSGSHSIDEPLPGQRSTESPWKRAADVTLSCIGILVLAPLMVLIALMVKLTSRGPALFFHERIGKDFRPFLIMKFRSMVDDAASLGGPVTIGEDARITFVGRLLRKAKLDELPQLLNILRGDMSFVGPRPECRKYVEMFRADYQEILRVRPGLTDLASIKYCDEATLLGRAQDPEAEYRRRVLPDKIRLAKRYIRRRSLWLDLKIILATFWKLVGDRVPFLQARGTRP